MKRQVVFPVTPNLFTPPPTLTQAPGSESAELNSSMPTLNFLSPSIGELPAAFTSEPAPATLNRPTSEKTSTEDMEALKTLMKHLYEKTKF